MNPDQLAQALVSKGGYNPTDAANAAKGPRAGELAREFGISSPSSSASSSGFSNNAIDLARQINQFSVQANQPAIQSLQASRPEISQKFATERSQLEGEKQPLQERYSNLITQLKGNQTSAENRQTVTTSREFSRRGIPLSSGVYEQELTNAVNPITQQYSGLIKDTGLQQEADLRNITNLIANLTGQEVEQLRAVDTGIGQLQAGNPSSAVSAALQQLQMQQQAEIAKQEAERLATQQAFQNRISEAELANQTKTTNYNINKPYYQPDQVSGNESAVLGQIFGNVKTNLPVTGPSSSTKPPLDSFYRETGGGATRR